MTERSHADLLSGIWSITPFPTAETTVIFCPEGKGLLFLYWGSDENTPYLDEFTWSVEEAGTLKVTWLLCHDYLVDDDCEKPEDSIGKTELLFYTLDETPAGRSLRLDIGYHWCMDDDHFTFTGPAESFGEERSHWQQFTANFDPFGPGRQAWLVDEQGDWQQLPGRVVDETPSARTDSFSGPFFGRKPWFVLMLIMGFLGMAGYLADFHKGILPDQLRYILLLPPLTIVLFSPPVEVSDRVQRFLRRGRQFGAVWYLLLLAVSIYAASTGWQRQNLGFFAVFAFAGLISALRVLHPRYGDVMN